MYEKIKELMDKSGETIMELSRSSGVPYTTLKNLELPSDREKNLSVRNAKLIAKHYGVTLDELCGGVS